MGRGRVGSWGAVAAAAFALAACNEARVAQSPLGADSSCAGCHTAPGEGPPFRDQTGSTDTNRVTVGAHDAHLHPELSSPFSCGECHKQPEKVGDPGHLDTIPPGTVQFGPLAHTGGANPTYVRFGCQAVYCHGNFRGGNRSNAPSWLGGAAVGQCGTCHDLPPPSGRHQIHFSVGVRCDQCHGPLLEATHVNGVVDVALPVYDPQFKTCAQACHGPRSWPGPNDANL
jgi:predicted CxxxxCH...CXXCH cytochrome family protein